MTFSRKNVTPNNITSYKKAKLQSLFREYIFGKTIGGGVKLAPHSATLFGIKGNFN